MAASKAQEELLALHVAARPSCCQCRLQPAADQRSKQRVTACCVAQVLVLADAEFFPFRTSAPVTALSGDTLRLRNGAMTARQVFCEEVCLLQSRIPARQRSFACLHLCVCGLPRGTCFVSCMCANAGVAAPGTERRDPAPA